jgi:hypothetical protein
VACAEQLDVIGLSVAPRCVVFDAVSAVQAFRANQVRRRGGCMLPLSGKLVSVALLRGRHTSRETDRPKTSPSPSQA